MARRFIRGVSQWPLRGPFGPRASVGAKSRKRNTKSNFLLGLRPPTQTGYPSPMNLTAAAAQSLPTVERAMALDLLDDEPVTHLFEDENPWFASTEETPFSVDAEADFFDFHAEHAYRDLAEAGL